MARTKRSGPGKSKNGPGGGPVDGRTGKPLTSSQNRKLQKQLRRAKEARKNGQAASAADAKALAFHPFDATEDRILCIGEGDFSFAHSLLIEHRCTDITATTNDSEEVFGEKYSPQGVDFVSALREGEQRVLFDVDATRLSGSKAIRKLVSVERDGRERVGWDVIMFNFPHVGGLSTDVNRQVRANQELLVQFFGECQKGLLSERGTVVVTLFEGEPYSLWNIKDLARHQGLKVVRSFRFYAAAYEGYKHVRTLGNLDGDGGWKGEERESRSYIFAKADEKKGQQEKKVKNIGSDDDD